jgi:asparagine synthase (glutamine-hydrolysing)
MLSPMVSVFADTAFPEPAGQTLVLGHLFERGARPRRIFSLAPAQEARALASNGQSLIADYWGGYVAVVVQRSDRVDIVRDPSATLPCYFMETPAGYTFASDPDVLVDTGWLRPAIDGTALTQHLYASDVRTARTCLKGLSELPAGFRATLTSNGLTLTSCWSPWEHTDSGPFRDRPQVAEALRETIEACVGAWGSAFQNPLLGVSGGLDSSIVASCLKGQDIPFTAYTVATDEAEGDERRYARVLTEALGIPLIERFHSLDAVSIEAPLSAHLPRPIGHAFGHSLNAVKFSLAGEHRADAMFTGVGGDNVFCFTQSASPLVDCWRSGGSWNELRETLNDICRLTRCSVGQAVAMAVQRALRPSAYRFSGDATYLNQGWSDEALMHPWLDAPKNALPGKAAHVGMMVRILATIDGFPRDRPPDIRPLLSQPIVEACLRVPMWDWVAGGQNRAVARAAFQNVIPKPLLERSSKGGPNSFAYAVVDHFKDAIRDRLTAGRLADMGIIRPDAIATAMAADRVIHPPDHMRLSMLLEAENWGRHWGTIGQRKAAAPPIHA